MGKTPKYNIKEKNNIVKEYLNGTITRSKILRKYNISSDSIFHRWVTQYRKYNTVKDERGKSSKGKGNFGRKKKIRPEEMSREELIKYVEATEDIKKLMVSLNKQKKNIK